MGFYSLFSISHDASDFIDKNPEGFLKNLRYYMNSGGSDVSEMLSRATGGAVSVISMRHSSENFIISGKKGQGFPSRLPYDEQREQDKTDQAATWREACEILGRPSGKMRIVDLLGCIKKLLVLTAPKREAVANAKDADARATRKLSDPNWRPSRAHVEGLRNELRRIHEMLDTE